MNEMCPNQPDKDGFVMSYQDAYDLVAETYTGYIQVNDNCRIPDWQSAKHIYHGIGMGVNPADYGFTQNELERIRGENQYTGGGGIIAYARRGYHLPPIEMVRDYSENLKKRCEKADICLTNVPFYDVNGKWSTTVYLIPPRQDEKRGLMIVFNESTTDMITGDKQKKPAFNRLREEGFIGSPKWTPVLNEDFTPLRSFDSDIRRITPLDSSSSNSSL